MYQCTFFSFSVSDFNVLFFDKPDFVYELPNVPDMHQQVYYWFSAVTNSIFEDPSWLCIVLNFSVMFLRNVFFFFSYNVSDFYVPSFDEPDFVCAMPIVSGMQTCSSEFIAPSKNERGLQCSLTLEKYLNKTRLSNNSNECVDWNQYYTQCKQEGDNPAWGAIGFDNIFIAWVAIFQVKVIFQVKFFFIRV